MNWLNTNFPNWKTTISGFMVALGLAIQDAVVNGTLHKSTILAIVGAAFWAFFTKDKNVTGGKTPATLEAEQRVVKEEKLEAKAEVK